MKPLLSFGAGLVDCLAYVPDSFLATVPGAKGGMELIDADTMMALLARLPEQPSRVAGGSAANTANGYGRLGGQAAMLAKVGSDEAADFYRGCLAAAGVDVSRFKVDKNLPTGTCISMITPDSERTMRTCLGASSTLCPADLDLADFRNCEHVHIEGYLLFNRELFGHVLQMSRSCGCVVSLDLAAPEVVAGARDVLDAVLRDYVDVVFANEAEAAAFCGDGDPEHGLRALSALCDVAVVKLGADGALISRGSKSLHVPAVKVNAVDTTGAGDIWAAGFLYGLLSGWTMDRAGELGARLGAEVVQVTGAALGDDVWRRMRESL